MCNPSVTVLTCQPWVLACSIAVLPNRARSLPTPGPIFWWEAISQLHFFFNYEKSLTFLNSSVNQGIKDYSSVICKKKILNTLLP